MTQAVQMLSTTSGKDNHVAVQVRILMSELCRLQGLPEPAADLERLAKETGFIEVCSTSSSNNSASSTSAASTGTGSSDDMDLEYEFDDDDEEGDEEEDGEEEDDLHLELEDDSSNKNKDKEGIDSEHIATLERLKANQRQDYLQGTVTGSVQASDRLMKELRDIYRSDTFKRGIINEWCFFLISVFCL